MVIIILETANFEFLATGADKSEAVDALRAGVEVHCDATGADPSYFEEMINEEEFDVYDSGAGGYCYCDKRLIFKTDY